MDDLITNGSEVVVMRVSGGRELEGRFGGMRCTRGQHVGTGPDLTDYFLSILVVIIPEIVMPSQQVASIRVSPWL